VFCVYRTNGYCKDSRYPPLIQVSALHQTMYSSQYPIKNHEYLQGHTIFPIIDLSSLSSVRQSRLTTRNRNNSLVSSLQSPPIWGQIARPCNVLFHLSGLKVAQRLIQAVQDLIADPPHLCFLACKHGDILNRPVYTDVVFNLSIFKQGTGMAPQSLRLGNWWFRIC